MPKALCSKIKNTPHIVLNDEEIGIKLDLVEEKEGILIFEKKYNNQAGFIFVVCDERIDIKKFKERYKCYSNFVKEKTHGMFKEVELVVVSKEISKEVKRIIDSYNESYIERKPIRYIILKNN